VHLPPQSLGGAPGTNPKTGRPIQIKASKTVQFYAGQGLEESL
jgi:nucleoid DNA-binding protein